MHACAIDLKKEISKKNELLSRKKSIIEAIKKGEQFFLVEENKINNTIRLSEGARRMVELTNELQEVEKLLTDIDIIIVSKLEMQLGDFVAKGIIPEKINDAGDIIPRTEVMLSPFKSTDSSMIEVTPDDCWFFKLAKQAMNVSGIEILKKPEM